VTPHPSPPIIRKTIKWGGAVVTVLLGVVWIGSAIVGRIRYDAANRGCGFVGGALVWAEPLGGPRALRIQGLTTYRGAEVEWLPTIRLSGVSYRLYILPLWLPTCAALALTVVAWRVDTLARRRERARLNLCPKCGYDRAGIAGEAKCPECGAMPVGA
jgi:hypothetical protein